MNKTRDRDIVFGNLKLQDWFCTKTLRNGDCLEWHGSRHRDGYGTVWVDGKSHKAHRIAWRLWRGEIPDGMVVMHTCDNPPCVDIHHLRVGTQADNMRDRDAKGRHVSVKGESVNNAKLTEADVREIRRLYATGNYHQIDIAEIFLITQAAINHIVNRKNWRHVK